MTIGTMPAEDSPILTALLSHHVEAKVIDLDHYRIHGGMAVETDYIVGVKPGDAAASDVFDAFTLSKSYSAFRTFASQLKKAADSYTSRGDELPSSAIKTAKYCELVSHLIESQRTQYLGKVNYMYVKVLAKQRSQLINDVLEATCSYFPDSVSEHALLGEVASIIETFFLTDHCEAVVGPGETRTLAAGGHHKKLSLLSLDSTGSNSSSKNPLSWLATIGSSKEIKSNNNSKHNKDAPPAPRSSIVVPMTRRNRRSDELREQDEQELLQVGEEAQLLLDDDRPPTLLVPNYARPMPTVRGGGGKIGELIEHNPLVFVAITLLSLAGVHNAATISLVVDGDVALLVVFAAFCIGLHTPRPMVGGFDRPPTMKGTVAREDLSGRRLLRRSMAVTPRQSAAHAASNAGMAAVEMMAELDEDDEEHVIGSPLPMFPAGAKIGSVKNCWSEPDPFNFHVRGPNYFQDKVKVASGDFIFPTRGLDLFLTDTCPENVGSNSAVLGGHLRDVPTFLINFRLPWGVLVCYFEIPSHFLPFIRAGFEDDFDKSSLPKLDDMTPGDRTTCRFLMNDTDHKNKTLKIVPVVVDGPWVVKQVVGGKPGIIGTKLPVNYVYQPAEGKNALYLEADLDIAASSAARGILSVARSYTQILTLDLGFVIQSNSQDELPEQMLVGLRIHGVDPLTAPSLPPMRNFLGMDDVQEDDDQSITPMVMLRE